VTIAITWVGDKHVSIPTFYAASVVKMMKTKIKVEVGVDYKTTNFEECNGKGKNIIIKDLVDVKARYDGCWVNSSEVGLYDFDFHPILSEHGNDCSIFSIELTDQNRGFFSKKRPRYSSED